MARRGLQRVGRVAVLLAALMPAMAAPAKPAPSLDGWSRDDAAHLIRRAGFDAPPAQIDRLHALGRDAAVEYLLTGAVPGSRAAPFDRVDLPALVIEPLGDKPDLTPQQRQRLEQGHIITQARIWWLDRMVRTDRPLVEKMALFWHGLFTSGLREVRNANLLVQQNALFREHALGNYRALTAAVLRDPAMLAYLNARENVKGKPNENLARELLELFTMGEGRGYTEKDVAEVARALTGATFNSQGYLFARPRHDPGDKTILGRQGRFTPDDLDDLIFARPEPARHLARRLWEFFVFAEPTEAEIAPVAEALRRSNYDVAPALRVLFTCPAFYSDKARLALVKSPVELGVGTLRLLEIRPGPDELRRLATALGRMGQELFQPPNVRGWPGGEAWITAATLYDRYGVATAIVSGSYRPGAGRGPTKAAAPGWSPQALLASVPSPVVPEQAVAAAVDRFLHRPLPPGKHEALLQALGPGPVKPGQGGADARVRAMVVLLLSAPEYQVH